MRLIYFEPIVIIWFNINFFLLLAHCQLLHAVMSAHCRQMKCHLVYTNEHSLFRSPFCFFIYRIKYRNPLRYDANCAIFFVSSAYYYLCFYLFILCCISFAYIALYKSNISIETFKQNIVCKLYLMAVVLIDDEALWTFVAFMLNDTFARIYSILLCFRSTTGCYRVVHSQSCTFDIRHFIVVCS